MNISKKEKKLINLINNKKLFKINEEQYNRIYEIEITDIDTQNLDVFIEDELPLIQDELDYIEPIDKRYDYYDLIKVKDHDIYFSFKNGLLHRDDGPAIIIKAFYIGYLFVRENHKNKFRWYKNGFLINDNNSPTRLSYIQIHDDDLLYINFFYDKNGIVDETSENHYIKYYCEHTSKLYPLIESWYKDGLLHNINGPAFLKWDKNGNLVSKKWVINGKNQENPKFKKTKSARK